MITKENIISSAKEFTAKFNITQGWTQEQHVGFTARVLVEVLGIERQEDKDDLISVLSQTCNPSAFRQTLERHGVLAKSEDKPKTLANKYL